MTAKREDEGHNASGHETDCQGDPHGLGVREPDVRVEETALGLLDTGKISLGNKNDIKIGACEFKSGIHFAFRV